MVSQIEFQRKCSGAHASNKRVCQTMRNSEVVKIQIERLWALEHPSVFCCKNLNVNVEKGFRCFK